MFTVLVLIKDKFIHCSKMQYFKTVYLKKVRYLLQYFCSGMGALSVQLGRQAELSSQFLFLLTVFGDEMSSSLALISCSWSAVGRVSELVCLFKVCFG